MITQDLKFPAAASADNKLGGNNTAFENKPTMDTGEEQVSGNYSKATFTKRHVSILVGTFMLLIGAAYAFYLLQPQYQEMNLNRMDTIGGMILLITGIFLLLFRLGFLAFIARQFFRYKPVSSVTDEELPTCTVIVPAYNEGKLVYSTLKSLVNSSYPAEKLELIAINDGSKDDTWAWMEKAKEELGDRVSIFQQPKNMGKRHALYRGFKLGKGEVFVTVDSDSIVEVDTLRNLVSPFITNENCGAVAGNVRVLNNQKAIIPRMLNVSFVFSFEFIRSAQSVMGSVLCTPGALAAYRRNAVMNCLEEWMNQTFMGQPTDIGEDRAMTNMILKQGFHVLFQRNAYVLTNIPEKYSSLHKMFTRWERSNVRENLMMTKFAFKPFRNGSRAGTRLLLVNQWMGMITAYPLILMMIILLIAHPVLFICSTLLSILIFSSLPAFFYAKKYNITEAFWIYSYSIFYTFGLFWITPYAMATASRRGWLTRG
ncbi:glycosyltransferase family 2 protein [Antarcticibacterium flavum]|uniref:Glycosyltransferase family 2 protein n=1 Tax=Antarcticibacterium flavum TaxID=2058175 RepID=A0A5B7X1E5_9FLAO|nr:MULTISPECIES: glycosyltransferase [Antarcticibacterium]MCM4161252.1 glycosyl transferase family 2 [Antarcticibacterium sp. W02-3]QCY68431.1 glycosyltransferase family 2 protein [Antarcticibacterium flavum]